MGFGYVDVSVVIEGAKVDDLVYLKEHKIDRNKVSQELSRIFSQMVYINGYFHADPHQVSETFVPSKEYDSSEENCLFLFC